MSNEVQPDAMAGLDAKGGSAARWTPAAKWVVARAMKLAAHDLDEVRVQHLAEAMAEIVRTSQAAVTPNDKLSDRRE